MVVSYCLLRVTMGEHNIVLATLPEFENKLATCRFDINTQLEELNINADIIFFQHIDGKKKTIRWKKEDYNFRYNNGTFKPPYADFNYVYHAGVMTKLCRMEEIHTSRGKLGNRQCTVLLNKCNNENKLVAISWLCERTKKTEHREELRQLLEYASGMGNGKNAPVIIGGRFNMKYAEADVIVQEYPGSSVIQGEAEANGSNVNDYFIYLIPKSTEVIEAKPDDEDLNKVFESMNIKTEASVTSHRETGEGLEFAKSATGSATDTTKKEK